jgi:branched-chain amino acid transport system substrate-binding protein
MILVEGIKKGGSDKEKVRDEIEKLSGFAGTGGIYNFSPTDHNGLVIEAFVMLTVKEGNFVLYKK